MLKRIKWSLSTWVEVAETFIDPAYLAAEFVADAEVALARAAEGDDRAAHVNKAASLYDMLKERDPIRTPMYSWKKRNVEALL